MAALQFLGESFKLHFISMSERNCVEPPHSFKFQHLPLFDASVIIIFGCSLVIDSS